MRTFHDKRAFVTGGASGIGFGVVKALAKRGAFVVIADLRTDHIDRALREVREAGFASSVAAAFVPSWRNRSCRFSSPVPSRVRKRDANSTSCPAWRSAWSSIRPIRRSPEGTGSSVGFRGA